MPPIVTRKDPAAKTDTKGLNARIIALSSNVEDRQ